MPLSMYVHVLLGVSTTALLLLPESCRPSVATMASSTAGHIHRNNLSIPRDNSSAGSQ